MSIFNQKSKFKIKTEVRKVKQAVPNPQSSRNNSGAPSKSAALPSQGGASRAPRASPLPSSLNPTKRLQAASSPDPKPNPNSRKRARAPAANNRSSATASPAPVLSDSEPGDDDDDDWRDRLDPSKRMKWSHTDDPDRRLRHPRMWLGQGDEEKLGIVHAVDVASLEDKCQPVMRLGRDEVGVRLRYPGAKYPER